MVNFKGIAMGAYDWLNNRVTDENLDKLKGMGFSAISPTLCWGAVENEDGTYNETQLSNLRDGIDRAKAKGFTIIISWRVSQGFPSSCNPWSDDKPTWEWLLTPEGTQRYTAFLTEMGRRFPEIMHGIVHFPFHGVVPTQEQQSAFYALAPQWINAIKVYNNQPVIFTPIWQGEEIADHPHDVVHWFRTGVPYNIPNVIYGVGHIGHGCMQFTDNYKYMPWSYENDFPALKENYDVLKAFKNRYGVQLAGFEYIGIHWKNPYGQAGVYDGLRPRQEQLDYLDASLKLANDIGLNWCYWHGILEDFTDDNLFICQNGGLKDDDFYIEPSIAPIIKKWLKASAPVVASSFLLSLLGILLILLLFLSMSGGKK